VSRGLAALPDGVWLARSLDAALAQCAADPTIERRSRRWPRSRSRRTC